MEQESAEPNRVSTRRAAQVVSAREFELAPPQAGTRFGQVATARGHALAWNASLAGVAKLEDTFLVGEGGLELVTTEPEWPIEPDGYPSARAAVLEKA